jgi:very-short-patch-repair endonuclease
MHRMDETARALRVQGIARRSTLIAAGMTDRQIAAAVRDRKLRRLRQGWFATADADRRIAAAVAAGGRLACVSALAARGVWVLREERLHVAAPDGSHRRSSAGIAMHHGRIATEPVPGALESVPEALERLRHCASPIEVVIAADSALEKGLVSRSRLEVIFGGTRRGRWILDRVDGRSQSGTETIARVALRGCGVRLRPQVEIPGVGRVDLLIGDRLVLEMDSVEWHTAPAAFEKDRRRDLDLAVLGYLVVRVTYARVIDEWAGFEADLLTLIRRREHRWRARHSVKNDAGDGARRTRTTR